MTPMAVTTLFHQCAEGVNLYSSVLCLTCDVAGTALIIVKTVICIILNIYCVRPILYCIYSLNHIQNSQKYYSECLMLGLQCISILNHIQCSQMSDN